MEKRNRFNWIHSSELKKYIWNLAESPAYKAQGYQVELTEDIVDSIVADVAESIEFISSSEDLDDAACSFLEKIYAKRALFEFVSEPVHEELVNSMPDNNYEELFKGAESAGLSLLKEQLADVLGTLTEREQKVLKLRYGLGGGRARTLEEVGREFDVTRERIHQIEAKALRKLRHPTRSK